MITAPGNLIKPGIELVGIDGNAFAIIGAMNKALRKAGNEKNVIDAFMAEATSGDYDHVIQTAMVYNGDV